MADTQSTTKFRADISQLKSEMQAASRLVKVANSEFKAATAGMDDWSKSADGLEKKIKQLNTILTAQKRQLALAKQEWEKTKKAYGENSAEADRAKIKLNNLEASVGKTEKELKNYEKELDAVGDESRETGTEIQQSSEGFTVMKGVLADLAATGIRMVIDGLKEIATEAFNAGANFEQAMAKVKATSGANTDEMEQLNAKAKEMGQSTIFSATESAEAFNYMAMAGWKTEDMLDGISGIMSLAAASGEDLANTSDIVTDALTAMGYGAGDATQLADVMAASSANANTNVSLMGKTFQYAAPLAGALGYTMEDVAVAIGLMANAGIKGDKAGTALRSMFTRLSAPPKDCAEAMDELGLSLTDNEGKMKPFSKVMQDLRKKFSGLSESQQTQYAKAIAGQNAMSGLLAVVNASTEDFDKLTDAVDNSNGAAENMANTMNDTVSGQLTLLKSNIEGKMIKVFEQAGPAIKDSIQSISDALDTVNWDSVADGVGNLTQKFADFLAYCVNNSGTVIGILKVLGTTMVSVFAVNKIATFVSSMSMLSPMVTGLATKMSLLTAAEGAAEGATLGLNTALLANPATLIIGGIAGLIAIMLKFRGEQQKSLQETYGLTKAEEDLNKSIEKRYKTQKESNASRQESVDGIASESNYTRKLVDAYNELVDENGKVSKKNKEHADFILNQLAQALGVEKDQIDDLIGKNGKLGDSIDELISKRQAEATLEAYQDSYSEAKQNQTKALNDLLDAHANYDEAVKKSEEAQKAYDEAYQKWIDDVAAGRSTMQNVPTDVMNLQQALDTTRTTLEQQKTALEQANQAYADSETTIKNYDALQKAVFSGDSTKINEQLSIMTNGLKTATSANRQELEKQVADRKAHYEEAKAAAASGNTAITQETVAELKKQYQEAKKELDKMPKEYKESGKKSGNAYASGQSSAKGKSKKAGQSLGKAGVEGEKSGSKQAKKTGQKTGQEYAKGIDSAKRKAKKSGEDLSKDTKKGVEKTAKESKKSGQKLSQDYAEGIKSKKNSAKSAGTSVGSSGKSGIQQGQGRAGENAGKDLGEGYARGIRSKIPAARAAAASLAKAGTKQIPKTQKSGSPSKITKQYGKDFSDGYIVGISSMEGALVKTVKGLVKSVTTTMADLAGYDFSGIGTAASSVFSEAIGKKVSYTIDKMTYQNEAKLAAFDSKISELESKKTSKTNELQKASDKKQDKIQKKIDKASSSKTKKRLQKQLNEEKSRVAKQIKASEKSYTKLINEQNKYKTAYQEASSKMISEFQNALSDYQSKAQALIDDTINGITTNYQTRYDELIAKQDQLIEKLKGAGELFEVSGAGVMTIGDLKEQTAAINDYAQKLQTIKNKVSAELFDQIVTYDMKEGSAFLDRLLAMSAADLNAYNQAYTEKMQAAQKAGESIYKTDFTRIKDDYEKEISAAFAGLPKKLEELGKQTMEGFVKGFTTNTDYMGKTVKFFVNNMVSTFKKELGIKSPSRVMYEIGEYTVGGFTDALKDGIKQVQGIVEDIVTETATPLSNMDINPGTVRTVANGSLTAPTSSTSNTVTNNYNLVQNNTSPKPLTALETYQARRRQVSMVKAMTQAV